MMRSVKVLDRQTLADLAVQHYGSAAAIIDICRDNGFELDHDFQAGDTILLQDSYPANADADYADYIKANNIIVVSFNDSDAEALGTNDDEYIITNDDNYISA